MCAVCGKAAVAERPGMQGDWVEFADYRAPGENAIGHPDGLEYFCSEHYPPAVTLTSLPSATALDQLRERFPLLSPRTEVSGDRPPSTGWLQRFARKLIGGE